MLKPSLQLRVGQQLTMTPQLQQAIRLLQLPILELNMQLREMLESNVMLELEEPAERETEFALSQTAVDVPPGESPAAKSADEAAFEDYDPDESGVLPDDAQDSALWSEVSVASRGADPWSEDRQSEIADTSGQSLHEHLLWQLGMEHFTPREVVIGEVLIDYINDDGYLTEPLDSILGMLPAAAGYTLAEAGDTLAKIQQLDPAGVGARDLAECLCIQLGQLGEDVPGRGLALSIAGSHLDLVAAQESVVLRRTLGVSEADLDEALALLRACHPKPGTAIQPSTTEFVVPDIFVRHVDGKWVVEVNRSLAPRLRVNQAYAHMLKGNGEHTVLRGQLQEARWLVRSLEIRNDTLFKVASCIVERQLEFFEHGEEHMKPMILKDIAQAAELHESTISRVTSGKYMHTPRGVFELRYFFSSQVSGDDGSEQSSTAIRAKIRKLIGQENPQKPLSDSRIAELLGQEGTSVARRTVAKYREALKIAPSSEHKRKAARVTGRQ
ncbi:MAG: RNA polymerase factor sigma-54 [Gammaproteobacteria bacterium]|nr:RNA polymerase factor sigma-54 [Gammaproteobacteria bacterium]